MRKKVFRIVIVLALAVAAAAGGLLWYRHETSPARVVERICGAIPGLEADPIREAAPGRVLTGHLIFRAENRVAAVCEGAEIRFGNDGEVESVAAEGVEISDLSGLLPLFTAVAASGARPPEFTASGVLVREARGGGSPVSSAFS